METKLLDFAKIYEHMQSSRLKKSAIADPFCLSDDERAQLKEYIIAESFK